MQNLNWHHLFSKTNILDDNFLDTWHLKYLAEFNIICQIICFYLNISLDWAIKPYLWGSLKANPSMFLIFKCKGTLINSHGSCVRQSIHKVLVRHIHLLIGSHLHKVDWFMQLYHFLRKLLEFQFYPLQHFIFFFNII